LWKAELQSDGLIYLSEEISKQESIQDAAWLLLTAYSQMREQRNDLKIELTIQRESQRKGLENLWPGKGRSKKSFKGVTEEGLVQQLLVKEIRADKRKLKQSTLHQDSKKIALRAPQKTSRAEMIQKRVLGPAGDTGLPTKHSSAAAMVLKGPDAASASGRPWHCSTGAGLADMQNARVPRSWRKAFQVLGSESLEKVPVVVMSTGAVGVKPQWGPQKSRGASATKHPPWKAASRVSHKPWKEANISLQSVSMATCVKSNRAIKEISRWRSPPRLQRMNPTTGGHRLRPVAGVESLQKGAMLIRSVGLELHQRVPTKAMPCGALGAGLPQSCQNCRAASMKGGLGELRRGDSSL
jgi:hypothetical protein